MEAVSKNEVDILMEPLTWKVQPWRSSPKKLMTIFAVAVLAGVTGAVFLRQFWLGAAGVAIVLGSTAEYWMGSRYKVNEKSAEARTGMSFYQMEWGEVRRVIVSQDNLRLSPLKEAGRLDPFRGVVLKFADNNREVVLRVVRERCADDVRFLEI